MPCASYCTATQTSIPLGKTTWTNCSRLALADVNKQAYRVGAQTLPGPPSHFAGTYSSGTSPCYLTEEPYGRFRCSFVCPLEYGVRVRCLCHDHANGLQLVSVQALPQWPNTVSVGSKPVPAVGAHKARGSRIGRAVAAVRQRALGSQPQLGEHVQALWIGYRSVTKPDQHLLDR